MGDLYAVITAVCWSYAVILFDISTKNFTAIQLNVLKNFIGVFGFILTIILYTILINLILKKYWYAVAVEKVIF